MIDENITVSVEEMREYDAYTIANFVPSKELMYRAAMGVYNSYDAWQDNKIAILVGGGNNGGDGYALAGILKKNDIDSVIIKVSDKMSDDGKYYFDIASELGVQVIDFSNDLRLNEYDIIVDCILGTGFKGEVRGLAGDAIEAINKSESYVISVDINSGMDGDTGEAVVGVYSDLTVSIGFVKNGLVTEASKKYIKKLTNVDIGIRRKE